MVVCLAFCMLAGPAASVCAQEYAPVVDDRVVTGDEQVPRVEAGDDKPEGWDLGAIISAAYDDNIFLSSTDPESDLIYRVAPTVAYSKGNEQEGEGGFVKAAYRPTGVFYSKNGTENRIDHQAMAVAGWRGKVTKVTYSGKIQKLGDATADTGRPTDRLEFENEIRAAWIPREKVTLEVAAGNQQTDYADPQYFDSRKVYAEAAVRYTYSPKTELGLIYQIGRFDIDGSGRQDTQQVTGRVSWQPREKIRFNLEAGAEHRKTDAGTNVNPVVEGKVEWKPREGTEVYLGGSMREEASAFYAGRNYSVRGATVGVSQKIGGNWTAKLEGGLEKNTYDRVPGSAGRKDRIWFVRPSVNYRINRNSDLSFFYRFSDDASSDPAFGYDQQMLGIELNHKF